ncbi:hypothetical protein B0H19DRAFT_697073 [Mycena capillaripes]|nr:hypothetical protein B0H19DRAFT_697073 [Mycena capillaripes]
MRSPECRLTLRLAARQDEQRKHKVRPAHVLSDAQNLIRINLRLRSFRRGLAFVLITNAKGPGCTQRPVITDAPAARGSDSGWVWNSMLVRWLKMECELASLISCWMAGGEGGGLGRDCPPPDAQRRVFDSIRSKIRTQTRKESGGTPPISQNSPIACEENEARSRHQWEAHTITARLTYSRRRMMLFYRLTVGCHSMSGGDTATASVVFGE